MYGGNLTATPTVSQLPILQHNYHDFNHFKFDSFVQNTSSNCLPWPVS
jgi:hypothetical protein